MLVVNAPAARQYFHLLQRIEDFAVQEFIAQFGVEAFAVAVLPRRTRLDVESMGSCFGQPVAQRFIKKLRAIVGTNVIRDSMLDHGIGQHFDHLIAVDSPSHMDRQTLSRMFVDKIQESNCPSVVGESAHEIVCPDVIGSFRSQAHAGAVVEPQSAARLLFLWHLQPLAAPDPLNAVLAYWPTRVLQLDGDASISIPAILAGQRDDGPGQRVLVVPLRGLIALRAAWLVHQLARMTLARPLLLGVFYSDTAPLRA